ncbi:Rieske [2Fe-2S] domain-containing protein [Quadrisphaera granulorum]|uniref:Rieske-like 2Fe-2S protein n=1 Tax=Quadrisphaera granulorum TaxID=317664 RepID=A0A316A8H2_9ACTN|nr:FAD-dependent oxidoreductase [Quadrisphaera granulorum]PWJ53933.1 Rieske-like 2Fe-2S protein [Quadrisphaera granulorum]SZE96390.1 Rieske [2Fe-2S] domain-containing protein [Quadrisphaera granulorum]
MAEDTDTTPDLTRGVPLRDLPLDGVLAGTLGTGDDAEQVLLTRFVDDDARDGPVRVSAVSATCTHVGAPLAKGLRTGNLVRCPFHHACFDLRSGEALLAPAYAPLTRYSVEVSGDGDDAVVRVIGPAEEPAPGPDAAVAPREGALHRVVVVGGGAAGFAAVERLRREGYDGELVLVSAEPHPPIDRTQLSKFYLAGAKPKDALPLLGTDWYAEHGVELRLASEATVLDKAQKRLTVRGPDGAPTVMGYDALVLAPGSEPVRPPLPGFTRDDVHVLRTLDDADALLAVVGDSPESPGTQRRAVVLGAGFIGLEAAAVLREKGVEVTVVATSPVPLARQMGEDVGRAVRAAHESEGVAFVTGRAARWNDGVLELEDGSRAPAEGRADLLVVGVGVTPRLDLAKSADLAMAGDDDGGGVLVDACGRTSAPGVWAAGDIAAWPDATTGRRRRVEHWAQAQRQGAAAALDILGRGEEGGLAEPAFFWTKQFSRQYRLAGDVPDLSDGSAEVDGSLTDGDAVIRYRDADGRVTAVAGVGRDLEVLQLEEELLRP